MSLLVRWFSVLLVMAFFSTLMTGVLLAQSNTENQIKSVRNSLEEAEGNVKALKEQKLRGINNIEDAKYTLQNIKELTLSIREGAGSVGSLARSSRDSRSLLELTKLLEKLKKESKIVEESAEEIMEKTGNDPGIMVETEIAMQKAEEASKNVEEAEKILEVSAEESEKLDEGMAKDRKILGDAIDDLIGAKAYFSIYPSSLFFSVPGNVAVQPFGVEFGRRFGNRSYETYLNVSYTSQDLTVPTENEESTPVTDGEGNPVTDGEGNPVTAEESYYNELNLYHFGSRIYYKQYFIKFGYSIGKIRSNKEDDSSDKRVEGGYAGIGYKVELLEGVKGNIYFQGTDYSVRQDNGKHMPLNEYQLGNNLSEFIAFEILVPFRL